MRFLKGTDMKIGIITGASSGLGKEMIIHADKYFSDIDEYWLIARSADKLEAAAKESGKRCRVLPLDLTRTDFTEKLVSAISEAGAEVALFVNNSGCGFLGDFDESSLESQMTMVDLNVRGMTAAAHCVLPFMKKGSAIINISSIASFCPNARMTVYSSTKAYVTSFSRGLGFELKKRGINVCAVCPGPMDTAFLDRGNIKGNSKTFEALPYCNVTRTAAGALKAAKRGKYVYTPTLFYKFFRLLAKILPHRLVMHMAKT